MEDEKIIIYNEENNYDTVVVENTDEIIYDETIQIIELDEPELFTVDTDEAFTSLGGQNEQLNHAILHNRDLPNQHIIGSITGLREELDEIESLKTVESDKRGFANYYMWKDEQSALPTDRVGYFVSVHTRDHKISICNSTTEIFGVTVGSAGFVGWQHYDEEDKPRDEEYVLVANTGVVKVKCWPSVVAGDYVMSSNDGRARKTDNGHGYYVISIDDSDGIRHAVISLDSTMNQVYALSTEVDAFNIRVDDVEIKTNAAINAATEALKQSFESSVNSALKDSQDALDKAESALDRVTDLEDGLTSEIAGVKVQVDTIEDSIVIASQEAAQKAVDELIDDAITSNQEIEELRSEVAKAQTTAEESRQEIRNLAEEMDPIISFNNGIHIGVAGVVASTEDNAVQLAVISQCLSNDYQTIDTWDNNFGKDTSQIYYVKDTGLYYYYDAKIDQWLKTPEPSEAGLSEVITSIRQKTDKDQAMVESLTSYSGAQYETILEWNGYQQVYTWSQNIADPYIIYYEEATGLYWQCDINNLETPWFSVETAPRNDLEEKDTDKVYYAEDTERYYCYYDNGWHSTDSSTAKLAQSIALTKQTADANSAKIEEILSYSGPDSDTLASIRASVEENKADIDSLTSYVQNNYTELDETWDEIGKNQSVIYYAKDSGGTWKYWYWKEDIQTPTWVGSTNPADAGLVASIANINQKATDNEAKITALTNWQGTTNDAIAKLEQSVGEDGASMESLVMNISKYTVGKYSQAYGLTVAEAKELLRDGTVFVPSENVNESYEKEDGIYYDRLFSKGRYYTWDKTNGIWVVSNAGGVEFTTKYILGNDTTQYIVVEDGYAYYVFESNSKNDISVPVNNIIYYFKDEANYYYYYYNGWIRAQDPNFEIGALYYWNTDKENPYWQKVATLESNTLNRAISQMRQTDNSIESSVANVKGDLVSVEQKVDDMKTTYITQTHFDDNITTIEQKSTIDTATLSMLAATGVIATIGWSETGKDTNKVYYDTVNKRYYYCTINANGNKEWNFADSVTNPNVATKIKSAGIITAINNDKSGVIISGDKISINAADIVLDGYVTFTNLSKSGETNINGENITTGVIKSKNYQTDIAGTQINLADGSIDTKNFKVDEDGNVTVNGYITANSLTSEGSTIIDGSRIATGYISVDRLESGTITAEKLAAGAITAEKINVGWQSGNFAIKWMNPNGLNLDDYFTITQNSSSPYYHKILLKKDYTSGTIRCSTQPFYASAGDVFKYGGTIYNKQAKQCGLFIEYAEKSDSISWTIKSLNVSSSQGSKNLSSSYTVQTSGWYRLTYALDYQVKDSYCQDVYCFRSVKGDLIVNGKISGTDGNTYFDLDNSIIKTVSNNYSTTFSAGGVKFYNSSDDFVFGMSVDSSTSIGDIVFPSGYGVSIGTGDDLGKVTEYIVNFGKDDQYGSRTIFFKPIVCQGYILSSQKISTTNNIEAQGVFTTSELFTGYTHERTDTKTKVKCGAGKSVPMWGTTQNRNTVAIELSDSNGQIARLDVSQSWGTACGAITLEGRYNGSGTKVKRSAPLELGTDDFWFDGTSILGTINTHTNNITTLSNRVTNLESTSRNVATTGYIYHNYNQSGVQITHGYNGTTARPVINFFYNDASGVLWMDGSGNLNWNGVRIVTV